MCSVLKVHPSGYYKWLKQPISNLQLENEKLLLEIKKAYKESNGIYGYRNIHKDLKALNMQKSLTSEHRITLDSNTLALNI
jgi:putative transposase